MKDKFKKIGLILLFVLFVISGVCLIASCSLKVKNNKLDHIDKPKQLLYKDNSNGAYLSNNLLQNIGTSYTYSVKDNVSNYNTATFLLIDKISAYTGNYFGGDKLCLNMSYYNLGSSNVDFYIYLSSKQVTSKSQLSSGYYTRKICYMYSSTSNNQGNPIHFKWEVPMSYVDLNNDIYVYICPVSNTTFNNTNLFFQQSFAFTYHSNTDEINSYNSFDYFGVFVPREYNSDVEKAINDSYNSGYSYGYSQGDDNGYNKGYLQGYNDGVDLAETGEFNDLIGAVVDTPLNILYNLFNFEILGVNLWVFITSILSICIAIWVIKKIKS